MPINTEHPSFKAHLPKIQKTTDAFEGSVKKYVPYLSSETSYDFDKRVDRSSYYNVTESTVMALIGALTRKSYQLEGIEDVNTAEDSLNEFIAVAYKDTLIGARIGIFVDYDDINQTPKLINYPAETIINWSSTYIVLLEHVLMTDPKDPYIQRSEPQYRELTYDEKGFYVCKIWNKVGKDKFEVTQVIEPTIRGQRLNFIPFYFVTPYDNSDRLYTPPMFNIADININHYKTSVDLCQGLHFLALPTPWIAGDIFTVNGISPTSVKVGTEEFLRLQQGSSVGMLEFSGAGLAAIETQLTSLETRMFSLGSILLQPKAGVESAEALYLRASSQSATLETIATSLETGLQAALNVYALWISDQLEIRITLNRDFINSTLNPSELSSLLQAYSQGVITLDTILNRLFHYDIIKNPLEEKDALINAQQPTPTPTQL